MGFPSLSRVFRHCWWGLLVAACLFAPSSAAHAEDWRTKKFQVVMVEPSGYTTRERRIDNLVEALARLARNDVIDIDGAGSQFWQVIDPETDELEQNELAEAVMAIEATLEATAERLEAAGFPSPALEPVITLDNGQEAYRVYLVRGMEGASGRYATHNCDSLMRRERIILLDHDDLLGARLLLADGRATVAHELFHAVQAATPFFQNCGGQPIGSWITEGSAEAVGWIIAGDREADLFGDSIWGLRDYSVRLPFPYNLESQRQANAAYRTSSFWTYLAEYEATNGKPTSPGTNPHSLKFLAGLFQASPVGRDCYTAQSPCWKEVEWLDNMSRLTLRSPLRPLYTKFIQAYSLYGPHRQDALLQYDERWLKTSFKRTDGCQEVALQSSGAGMQQKVRIEAFPELSALCWKLSLEGFDSDTVGLGVTVEAPSAGQTPSLSSLNSAIADGPWLKAQAKRAATGREEVHWEYVMDTGQGTPGQLFLMTNIADQAVDTPRFGALDVTFTVRREYVAIRGQGGSGSSSNADIDSPVSLSAKAVSQFWGPMRIRAFMDAGLDEPCLFRFDAIDADKTSGVAFMLLQNGPMPTGEYPIARPMPNETVGQDDHARKYEGQVVATFTLGEDHPLIGEYGMEYMGQGGALRIEAVSPRWITGNIRIAGTWSGRRPTYLPHDAPAAGPRNLEIEVDFSVPNASIASRVNVDACIKPPD